MDFPDQQRRTTVQQVDVQEVGIDNDAVSEAPKFPSVVCELGLIVVCQDGRDPRLRQDHRLSHLLLLIKYLVQHCQLVDDVFVSDGQSLLLYQKNRAYDVLLKGHPRRGVDAYVQKLCFDRSCRRRSRSCNHLYQPPEYHLV